jgi:hypothetical protein
MNLATVASRPDFEKALQAARAVGPVVGGTNLNAVADAGLLGRLDEVWDTIEAALKKGYKFGADRAREMFDAAVEKAERLIEEAGSKANDLHQLLLEKLRVFVNALINSALQRMPDTLALAGKTFRISKVSCSQKIVLTGSITTNMMEVFSLAASGELEVAAEYGA